jgi:hypothetical protein
LQQAKECHKACTDQKKTTTTKIEERNNYVWRGANFLKEDNDCYTQKESYKAKQGDKFVGKHENAKHVNTTKKSFNHKDRSSRRNYFWRGDKPHVGGWWIRA